MSASPIDWFNPFFWISPQGTLEVAEGQKDAVEEQPAPHNRAQALEWAIRNWIDYHELKVTADERDDLYSRLRDLWADQQIEAEQDRSALEMAVAEWKERALAAERKVVDPIDRDRLVQALKRTVNQQTETIGTLFLELEDADKIAKEERNGRLVAEAELRLHQPRITGRDS